MPELPEVEVVKKSLEKEINNLTLKNVRINDGKLRYSLKKKDFDKIIGSKIINIKRRSKYLIFIFNNSLIMIVHLGMTGKFYIIKNNKIKQRTSFYYHLKKEKYEKHDRLIFHFSKNTNLVYNDVRKFGFIKFDYLKKLSNNVHLKKLGPEPFNKEFNFEYFKNYLVGKKRNIKDLLMDQKFVAGLGNIYVNEILFVSKIKPLRKVKNLKNSEINMIIKNTKVILKKAIYSGGSSIQNFSNSLGNKGKYQQHFSVYGKKGKKCSNPDCKKIIQKIVIANRASFFCTFCQK